MVERTWANKRFFLAQLDPEVRKLVRTFDRLHVKILETKQFAVSNQSCLDNDLLPKYTITGSLA